MRRSLLLLLLLVSCSAAMFAVVTGQELSQDEEETLKLAEELLEDREKIEGLAARQGLPELGYAIASVYTAIANILGRFPTTTTVPPTTAAG